MIEAVRRFFEDRIQPELERGDPEEHAVRLATAALLVELSRADFHVSEQEREALQALLAEQFELSAEETRQLIALAEEEARAAVSLYPFTDLIDKTLDHEQKRRVLYLLWRLAFADGHKDKYEEHLVRKVADLIHLRHRDFIQTRLEAEADARQSR